MDRKTIFRWIMIAAAVLLLWKCGLPLITGNKDAKPQATSLPEEKYTNAPDFVADKVDKVDGPRVEPEDGETCTITTDLFIAELVERGAGIKHFKLLNKAYGKVDPKDPNEIDASQMGTTPNNERWRSLRTLFRPEGVQEPEKKEGDEKKPASDTMQVSFDRFKWTKQPDAAAGTCVFTYEEPGVVKIEKKISAEPRPYELQVATTITNLAKNDREHRFAIQEFAYRKNADEKGSLGRVSPFQTELSCARDKEVERKSKDDFKTGWFDWPLADRYSAISNYYFAQALVPLDVGGNASGDKPECRILAEEWYGGVNAKGEIQKPDDDDAGHVYHAELRYKSTTLKPTESVTYRQLAFFGPKERDILAAASSGGTAKLGDLINLGFFSPVAKVLVGILTWIHGHLAFGNWGVSIIMMTIGLRMVLFPLTWKSIKTTVGMRKLKPEIDELTKKFKEDPQAKNLAMMELYRKHKVNPFGGCLPQLVQMPVWFAMYTTLQTAVEMYHTPFLWFRDLSSPDKFYILPILLGGFMILQQRIVPQQGMDPMQQKMMNWLLPVIFTVMMLFLPAALGVYMLTNSILGIVQQLAVEKFAPRGKPTDKGDDIVVKQVKDNASGGKGSPALVGKGKARV